MVDDEDGDDFPWFQGVGWIMGGGYKGKILEAGGWINEAFTIIVQKDDKGFNLLFPWPRASLYYEKNFSEIEKKRRVGLCQDCCEFMWGMREK